MIAFRDFTASTPGSPLSDGVDKALVAANEWLARTGIRPLNVETLSGGSFGWKTNADRGLRVWYEVLPAAPEK